MKVIENCTLKFECDQTWNSLVETSDPKVRYCYDCDRGVHYCYNQDELDDAIDKNWCVAFYDPRIFRLGFIEKWTLWPYRFWFFFYCLFKGKDRIRTCTNK